jgi:glutamate--cysteine ligase
LQESGPAQLLKGSRIGIEKESLRVSSDGVIAQTPHPSVLGAALTHPHVTTDYSEALTEFITRPHRNIPDVMQELDELHRWVYSHLDDEIFWATSMPCILKGEESIRIADYGPTNLGMMKTVYRRGLGYRYGRMMQVIAGVHFNYSFSDEFWDALYDLKEGDESLQDFRSDGYMSMLRNLKCFGWLVPYLFGASPAVCESFLKGNPTTLEYLGYGTYFESFATSLRLGDIGYQNKQEGEAGVHINFESLKKYIATLENAIETSCPRYEAIGIKDDGYYKQLNTMRLQIENEYYCSVRPKVILKGLEKPVRALEKRGIEYIELRSVDLNVFDPLGVNEQQLYFLEALMVYALLQPSPELTPEKAELIDDNLSLVAHNGRDPELTLSCSDGKIKLRNWANDILYQMQEICVWLDENSPTGREYSLALKQQQDKIAGLVEIPSTQMLALMRSNKESFFDFSMSQSTTVAQHFRERPLSVDKQQYYDAIARRSRKRFKQANAEPQAPFETFLEAYFAQ